MDKQPNPPGLGSHKRPQKQVILTLPAKAHVKTAAQAREEFARRGISISKWAEANSVHRSVVYEVLSGNRKCYRGMSHKVAVLLGMKHGEIVND